MEDNLIEVKTRTQVYLTDPDFFCNKSWTISYGVNTKSWNSFHSYIPNFYIAENNFFYSGLNGCCTDIEGNFTALVGDTNKQVTTTTSTTQRIIPPITTTTTTLNPNCNLTATVIQTSCNLEATAIMTVPPTPTTTICQRPFNLIFNYLYTGYKISGVLTTTFINFTEACNAATLIKAAGPIEVVPQGFSVQAASYNVNSIIYKDQYSTDCTLVEDGWYFTEEGVYNGFVLHIQGGVIVEKATCDCNTTTTTTTSAPVLTDCCDAISATDNNVYYFTNDTIMNSITIPGFTSATALAFTSNYLWSITSTINIWDINIKPFSATFNRSISIPSGVVITSGIVAKDDDTIIVVNNTGIMVSEINTTTSTVTPKFTITENRVPIGNLIYTGTQKLILLNLDTNTNIYYLTQYDYPTGTIEYDITISTITPSNLYECNCAIFIIDDTGKLWSLDKNSPYTLVEGITLAHIPDTLSQISTCFSSEIPLTTTTTTTV